MARYRLLPGDSEVSVRASSNLHAITMVSSAVEGWFDDDTSGGAIELRVDSLRSDNPLYDREGARRLDVKHYPTITGRIVSATPGTENQSTVRGELTFHGATREVEGELRVSRDGERIVIEGEQEFDVREWGVKPPRLLMLRVHPEARVRVRLVGEREATSPG